MRWLAVAVLISGWAWAAWRNAPPVVGANSGVFGVGIVLSLAAAFWFGRRTGRAAAVAVATARAEARATAAAVAGATATNQVVLNIGHGARAAAGDLGGLDRVEWMGAPVALVEQDHQEMWAEEMHGEYEEQREVT